MDTAVLVEREETVRMLTAENITASETQLSQSTVTMTHVPTFDSDGAGCRMKTP
jgi:hypothetical protein